MKQLVLSFDEIKTNISLKLVESKRTLIDFMLNTFGILHIPRLKKINNNDKIHSLNLWTMPPCILYVHSSLEF